MGENDKPIPREYIAGQMTDGTYAARYVEDTRVPPFVAGCGPTAAAALLSLELSNADQTDQKRQVRHLCRHLIHLATAYGVRSALVEGFADSDLLVAPR